MPTPTAVPRSDISFHNRLAVRIGFLVALTGFLPFMFLLPIPFVPSVIAFLTGFLAVFSYSRLTGQSLSVRSGARMGWITGVFSFAIIAAFFALSIVVIATQGKLVIERLRDYQGPFVHLKSDQIDAVTKILQDPATFAASIAGVLLMLFIMLTALPMLGGALGAKVFAKE